MPLVDGEEAIRSDLFEDGLELLEVETVPMAAEPSVEPDGEGPGDDELDADDPYPDAREDGATPVTVRATFYPGRGALMFDDEGAALLRMTVAEDQANALLLLKYQCSQQRLGMRSLMRLRIRVEGEPPERDLEMMVQFVLGVTALQFDGYDGSASIRFLIAPDFTRPIFRLKRRGVRKNLYMTIEVLSRDRICLDTPPPDGESEEDGGDDLT